MSILDFFDVHNVDHLKAWRELSRSGVWPEGFIPEDTTFPHMWMFLLMSRMSDAWVENRIANDYVENIP